MGEAQGTLFEPEFNRSIKVQTSDQRITSHAGAVLLRELDHQLGLVESLGEQLTDPRNPDKIRYIATELVRERIYALALDSANQDDLDRLAHDPAMRMATWDRPGEDVLEQRLASQPTQSRLIDWLANFPENREAVRGRSSQNWRLPGQTTTPQSVFCLYSGARAFSLSIPIANSKWSDNGRGIRSRPIVVLTAGRQATPRSRTGPPRHCRSVCAPCSVEI